MLPEIEFKISQYYQLTRKGFYPAEQLYPENYDLNVVLLSKEDRKAKRRMEKHHQPGQERIISIEEQE